MIDPVINMMGKISSQESGGNYGAYNHDSGAFGAYQFMPETWNDTCNRYGLNPDDKSPNNQDEAAYNLMSEYFDTYKDPRAVASMWYSGKPDFTNENDQGNYPAVAQYTNSVMNRGGNVGNYYDRFLGQTMDNGTNGCVEFVGLAGTGTSGFLANQYNNKVFDVPSLVSNAQHEGIPVVPFDMNNLSAGDVAVYGDNDHVTLADGNGGYYGNSSSENKVIHGNDITQMGGLMPTKIIKTGGRGNNFMYQAKDANGYPFLNMMANVRTSNPNERFDQQGIMSVLGSPNPDASSAESRAFLFQPDYNAELLTMPEDVAKYVQPTAQRLMDNREADIKSQIAQQNQEANLQRASGVINLINSSGNVDNRRGYAALAKMYGLNIPDGADQFVSGDNLLQRQIQSDTAERTFNAQQRIADRNYALQKQNTEWEHGFKERSLAQQLAIAGMKGTGTGAEKGLSPSMASVMEQNINGPMQEAVNAINTGKYSSEEARNMFQSAVEKAGLQAEAIGTPQAYNFLGDVVELARGKLENNWGAAGQAGVTKAFGKLDNIGNNPVSRFFGLAGYK